MRVPGMQWRLVWWLAVLPAAALLATLLMVPRAASAQVAIPRAMQVEAAFLVNFVRFTQWPPARFESPGDPYVIAVVGGQQAADTVRAVAGAAGNIQGRRIAVIRVDPKGRAGAREMRARLRGSHLVFVQGSLPEVDREVLSATAGLPLLTVGDSTDFAARGGMLGLVRDGPRLAFEANPEAIQAAGVMVSAKVLKLARLRRTAQ